ncbi:hypothetical protein GCM10010277_86110 [Streptomyces longisporoflavus]|nr:hypothetical protein GCM10010277_86110 [Streptomyces longisporoflavus]
MLAAHRLPSSPEAPAAQARPKKLPNEGHARADCFARGRPQPRAARAVRRHKHLNLTAAVRRPAVSPLITSLRTP